MSNIDYLIFGFYFVLLSVIGLWSGRKREKDASDYFLAGRSLPWYAVGGSFVASNISGEHFIGQVGAAFLFGVVVAMSDWGNILTFSILIWFFIPFLLASRAFTIPEFLEQRFGIVMRQFFAVVTIIANIVAFLAAVLYAGGLALHSLFDWNLNLAIFVLAFVSGAWAIYGGLRSVVWTDLFTLVILVFGGLSVTWFGLQYMAGADGSLLDGLQIVIEKNRATVGEWKEAVEYSLPHVNPEGGSYDRLSVIQPLNHPLKPWPHLIFGVLTISIWYNVLNQFIVQRVLAAKDAYHARMGIVFAGYLKLLMPAITTLPGLIFFALYPEVLHQEWGAAKQAADQSYVVLVRELVPAGVAGLVLAALFGAIQSTVNSVLNSTSTVFTIDIYKRMIRPKASDRETVYVGMTTTVVVLIIAIILALFIDRLKGQVFLYIQTLYAFFAAPFGAVFLLGLLWHRINNIGATITVFVGFLLGILIKTYIFLFGFVDQAGPADDGVSASIAEWLFSWASEPPQWLYPFGNQALITWAFCVVLCIAISVCTRPEEATPNRVILQWGSLPLGEGLGRRWYSSVLTWWLLWAVCVGALIYVFSGAML